MFQGTRIVLVEDDHIMGKSISQRLELEGAEVIWVKQAVRAIHAIRTPRAAVHAVICDIRLPDGSGEEVFTALCQTMTPPPFLFITGQGGIDQAVRLLRAGAADYVTKPFEMSNFLERLRLLVALRQDGMEMPAIFGISPAAATIDALAAKAAQSSVPVLIQGPLGTGKAQLGRRIHNISARSAAPLVEVNLARDPSSDSRLIDPGSAIEETGEGSLLLIALERLPRRAQDALSAALDADFAGRIISTAGPELARSAAIGNFRADLLARLSQVNIPVPPLRDRPKDALWLVTEMLQRLMARGAPACDPELTGLSSLAEEAIRSHDWPDNGREVRSRVLRAMQLAQGSWIQPADLFPERRTEDRFLTLSETRDTAERQQIVAALEHTNGHIGEAARLLQVSRTTLWEKMQKLRL